MRRLPDPERDEERRRHAQYASYNAAVVELHAEREDHQRRDEIGHRDRPERGAPGRTPTRASRAPRPAPRGRRRRRCRTSRCGRIAPRGVRVFAHRCTSAAAPFAAGMPDQARRVGRTQRRPHLDRDAGQVRHAGHALEPVGAVGREQIDVHAARPARATLRPFACWCPQPCGSATVPGCRSSSSATGRRARSRCRSRRRRSRPSRESEPRGVPGWT